MDGFEKFAVALLVLIFCTLLVQTLVDVGVIKRIGADSGVVNASEKEDAKLMLFTLAKAMTHTDIGTPPHFSDEKLLAMVDRMVAPAEFSASDVICAIETSDSEGSLACSLTFNQLLSAVSTELAALADGSGVET